MIVHFIGIPFEYKSGKFICSLITHILRQRKNIPNTLICVSIIVYSLLIVANIFINNMVKNGKLRYMETDRGRNMRISWLITL